MITKLRLAAGVLLLGSVLGCDRSADESALNSEIINGQGPTATPTIDEGVLKDPATYTPTAFDRLDFGDEDETGGSGGDLGPTDESPVATAVRDSLRAGLTALFLPDLEGALELLPPASIAAFTENPDNLDLLFDFQSALSAYNAAVTEATAGTALESNVDIAALLPKLVGPFVTTAKITPISDDVATVTVDMTAFREAIPADVDAEMKAAMAEMMAAQSAMGGVAPGGAQPGGTGRLASPRAAGAAPSGMGAGGMGAGGIPGLDVNTFMSQQAPDEVNIPMRLVDGLWRIDVPFELNQEQADWIAEGVGLATQALTSMQQAVAGLDNPDAQTLMQAMQQASMSQMMGFMGWIGRAPVVFPELAPLMQGAMPTGP